MDIPLGDIKTVIIAGGVGKRLQGIATDKPKPMIDLLGKPILEHILSHARKNGLSRFLLKTGYLSKKIEDYFGNGGRFNCAIEYFVEKEPMGTCGGLKHLEKEKQPVVVLYGDVLINIDLRKIIDFHFERGAQATLVVHESRHPEDSDVVIMNKSGEVEKLVHKPGNADYGNITNAALYILNPECFSLIPESGSFDFGKDILPSLVKNKFKVYGYYTTEYLKDIGTAERLKEAENDLRTGKVKT